MAAADDTTAAADRQAKRLASLRAAYAMAGHQLHVLADGRLLAVWHGAARELPDLAAVETLARTIGLPV